ncbi:MAG: site-2 protease family protein [Thermodesulfobacteriota bacterium]|nr:site-2 protease family protein [Thermodesulfobacteriota bacterium]
MLSKELLLIILPIVLFSLSVHEYSHGYSALLLGDKTAQRQGRLTLNPIKHLDLIGTLAILFIGIGWAKPVPVMVGNLIRGRKSLWIVAIAGPLSNFIIAIFFSVIFNLFDMSSDLSLLNNTIELSIPYFFLAMIFLNVALGIFNLLPIPPLDGGNIIYSLLPDKLADYYSKFSGRLMLVFIVLIFLLVKSFPSMVLSPVITIVNFLISDVIR